MPVPQTIFLTENEQEHAVYIGEKRWETVQRKQLQVPTGQPKDHAIQRANHILGALGECAFAKITGRYWQMTTDGPDDGGDVGPIAVRTTERRDGSLLILKRDDPERLVAMVIAIPEKRAYSLRGWIQAKDGMKEEYYKDPTGNDFWAYFVPQDILHDPQWIITTPWNVEYQMEHAPEVVKLPAHRPRPAVNRRPR